MTDLKGFLQDLAQNLESKKPEIMAKRYTGEAGFGAVKITIDGTGAIRDIEIKDEYLQNKETLRDLILIADKQAREELAADAANWHKAITNPITS